MIPLAIDIGNVICKMTPEPFILKLSEIAKISEEESWRFFRLGTAEHDLGHITIRDQMIKELGVSNYAADFLVDKYWNPMLEVDADVMTILLDYLKISHLSNYSWDLASKIAILSNMGWEHFETMKEKLKPLFDHGDRIIPHFSCEVGARKPSKLFYQSFLVDHPEFKGALYIDDLAENIKAGKKNGFIGFQFSVLDEDKDEKLKHIRTTLGI